MVLGMKSQQGQGGGDSGGGNSSSRKHTVASDVTAAKAKGSWYCLPPTNISLRTQVTGSPYECVVTSFVFKSSCKAKEILTSSIPKYSHYNTSQCTSLVSKQRVTPCLFQLFVISGPGWCLSD